MKNIFVIICAVLFGSNSAFANVIAITTGSAPDWRSEYHCVSLAKISGLKEHSVRMFVEEGSEHDGPQMFAYHLGYAEGFVRAAAIATKSTEKEMAFSTYQAQCLD